MGNPIYGYFRIEFYTGDGCADADAAKRAYDWCNENLDWFRGDGDEMPFLLNGNSFDINEKLFMTKTGCRPAPELSNTDFPDNVTWLASAFNAVKATRLVASLWIDSSEWSCDSNSYYEGVWERGKTFNYYMANGFNSRISPSWYNGHIIDTDYDCTYREYRALFVNKRTGEEILAGELISENPGQYKDEVEGTLKIGEAGFCVEIENESIKLKSDVDKLHVVKAFVSLLKKANGYFDADETEWSFERFRSQRDFFTLYGSNPAVAKYKELAAGGLIKGGDAIPSTITDQANVKTVFINTANEDGYPEFDSDFDYDELEDAAVVLGENIRKICYGDYDEGFSGSEIKSVRFSKNLEAIEAGAFSWCQGLEEIIYDGTMEEWKRVDVDEKAFCGGGCYEDGDSTPREYVPADEIKCSDGVITIDKSDEGSFVDADEYEDEE